MTDPPKESTSETGGSSRGRVDPFLHQSAVRSALLRSRNVQCLNSGMKVVLRKEALKVRIHTYTCMHAVVYLVHLISNAREYKTTRSYIHLSSEIIFLVDNKTSKTSIVPMLLIIQAQRCNKQNHFT